jgi:hypothetical protein
VHGHFAGLRDLIVQKVRKMPAQEAHLEMIARVVKAA